MSETTRHLAHHCGKRIILVLFVRRIRNLDHKTQFGVQRMRRLCVDLLADAEHGVRKHVPEPLRVQRRSVQREMVVVDQAAECGREVEEAETLLLRVERRMLRV